MLHPLSKKIDLIYAFNLGLLSNSLDGVGFNWIVLMLLCAHESRHFFFVTPLNKILSFVLQRGKEVQNCDGSTFCDFHLTRICLAQGSGGRCGVRNNFTICDFADLGSLVFV